MTNDKEKERPVSIPVRLVEHWKHCDCDECMAVADDNYERQKDDKLTEKD